MGLGKSHVLGMLGGAVLAATSAFGQGMPGDPIIVVPQQQEMPGEALIIESADDDKENEAEPGLIIERVPRNTDSQDNAAQLPTPNPQQDLTKFRPIKKPAPPSNRLSRSETLDDALASNDNLRRVVIPLNGIQLSGAAASALSRQGFILDSDKITVSWPRQSSDRDRLKKVGELTNTPLSYYGEFFECRTGQSYVCSLTVEERETLARLATSAKDENCPIELSENGTDFAPASGTGRGTFTSGPQIDVMDVMEAVVLKDRGQMNENDWTVFMNAACAEMCGRPSVYRSMTWRPGGLEYTHQGYKTLMSTCSAR